VEHNWVIKCTLPFKNKIVWIFFWFSIVKVGKFSIRNPSWLTDSLRVTSDTDLHYRADSERRHDFRVSYTLLSDMILLQILQQWCSLYTRVLLLTYIHIIHIIKLICRLHQSMMAMKNYIFSVLLVLSGV
jgi:hypothetical protein